MLLEKLKKIINQNAKARANKLFFGGETAVVGDRLIIEKGSDLKGDEYSIYDLKYCR